jgi:dihydrofolate synthase/folylpolyglutamate synthase
MQLQSYLASKPLYYDVIDYTRMPRVYAQLAPYLHIPKIIHVLGTNGKGTTGRFLASALHKRGFSVGHYTSPHILAFNERIWRDGANVSDAVLEAAHEKLQNLLDSLEGEKLSYFEYTTLLAMLVYEGCDYVVLEAGLGGEHDATAVFPKVLTLITPIDFDHESFLGSTIEEIAATKINAMEQHAIIAEQKYPKVYEIAHAIALKKGGKVFRIAELSDAKTNKKIEAIAQKLLLPAYLKANLELAAAALEFLGVAWEEGDFDNARLFGRMSKVAPNVYLDVGHNPLAAQSIAKELTGKKVILVYNTYKDKDYKKILAILRPVLWHVEIINVNEGRIVARKVLEEALRELAIPTKTFEGIVDKERDYLVFGSFSVAEQFLKNGYISE